ncbi:MAG TPA: hypothetical protein VMR99_02770 [Candidatus Paceibacterota bacterium]|nr:hypothetical protein [Candidatus Paceibacterota bacterium]
MSYPAITDVLNERNIDLETADDEVLTEALWEAFHRDLPDGIRFVEKFANDFTAPSNVAKKRSLFVGDPNSPVAKQVNRLLGTDIARAVCERKLGVVFGFYNCHAPVVSYRREDLCLSLREQIKLQNGALASADC